MVPVGGSIVGGFDEKFIEAVSKTYPGRASMAPVQDLFITLLSLGAIGWKKLLREREENMKYFTEKMRAVAVTYGERLLLTPDNPISLGMTLSTFRMGKRNCSYFGSMLFSRQISGPRTVPQGASKEICGVAFQGYGAHLDNYPFPYLTVACAIGMAREEIDVFFDRLDKCVSLFRKQQQKEEAKELKQQAATSDEQNAPEPEVPSP